jgi:hypothetical protein
MEDRKQGVLLPPNELIGCMRIPRLLILAVAHAALAGYFAAMVQQWIPVSSGRASPLTLVTPSAPFVGALWAAAAAGAVLGPALHVVLRRTLSSASRPRLLAAGLGFGYAIAVMFVTTVIWIPWTTVQGRGENESLASAFGNAVFVIVLGTPLFVTTSALLFAPVLLIGGAAIGMVALMVERHSRR